MLQLLIAFTVFASVPPIKVSPNNTLSYLRKEEKPRLAYFKNKTKELETIIFSEAQTFQYRWMAFTTLAKLEPSQRVFERALKSNEWFLRDVALKASLELFPAKALDWNRHALNDVALVVRTTAVKNLKRLQDAASVDLLWDELYAKRNFRKSQGLWIRKHILDSIVSLLPEEKAKEKLWQSRLIQVLKTEDESLQPFAFAYLKQTYPQGPHFVKDEPMSIQRKKWVAYLDKKN
jgi:hypothetical protein